MAKQAEAAITKRAFLKDLRIQFGVMEATGTLYTPLVANAKKGEQFRKVCPVDALQGDAVPVAQRYVCTEHEDHGLFEPSECQSAKEVSKDELVLVDKDAIRAAKEASDLPKNTLVLTSHDAASVEPYLVHTGSTYVFSVDSDSQFYAIMHRILADDSGYVNTDTGPKILMGEMVVRGDEKVFRLSKWNGQIVLQEIARPEDVDRFPDASREADDKLVVLTRTLVDANTEEFNAGEYRKTVRDRYAALVEAAGDGIPVTSGPAKRKESTDDLAAMLEAAIAASAAK